MNYFKTSELACRCCGEMKLSGMFIQKLNELREKVGFPLAVSSGYRCPKHNNNVSSTGFTGPHTREAVDLLVAGDKAYTVVQTAMAMGFTGIGVSQKGPHNKRFIHLDRLPNDATTPRPYVWSY